MQAHDKFVALLKQDERVSVKADQPTFMFWGEDREALQNDYSEISEAFTTTTDVVEEVGEIAIGRGEVTVNGFELTYEDLTEGAELFYNLNDELVDEMFDCENYDELRKDIRKMAIHNALNTKLANILDAVKEIEEKENVRTDWNIARGSYKFTEGDFSDLK
jgi:hypothetical protein